MWAFNHDFQTLLIAATVYLAAEIEEVKRER